MNATWRYCFEKGFPQIVCVFGEGWHTLTWEGSMNKLMLGMVVGMLGATVIVTCSGTKCIKHAKKVLLGKIEDILK